MSKKSVPVERKLSRKAEQTAQKYESKMWKQFHKLDGMIHEAEAAGEGGTRGEFLDSIFLACDQLRKLEHSALRLQDHLNGY
jgi:hypothetical protein